MTGYVKSRVDVIGETAKALEHLLTGTGNVEAEIAALTAPDGSFELLAVVLTGVDPKGVLCLKAIGDGDTVAEARHVDPNEIGSFKMTDGECRKVAAEEGAESLVVCPDIVA